MGDNKSKKNNTWDSNVVPHRSTNQARRCLTSQSGRDAVLSSLYGRSCCICWLDKLIRFPSPDTLLWYRLLLTGRIHDEKLAGAVGQRLLGQTAAHRRICNIHHKFSIHPVTTDWVGSRIRIQSGLGFSLHSCIAAPLKCTTGKVEEVRCIDTGND
jgi:hypothetical protein